MSRPSLDSTRSLQQHRQMSISLRKFSSIELLIALFALFVSIPFSEPLRAGVLIESILISIVLISAIFTVAASRRALLIAVVLALPTLAGRWIHQFRPDVMPPELFLSFITMSTVGYGDITPVAKVARMLAAMEAITGLLYVAILIARLVALHVAPKSHGA